MLNKDICIKNLSCDVVIIGSGAAGIRAAIEASDNGADVTIVTKGRFGLCGSSFYSGVSGWGLSASVQPEDSIEYHYEEIINLSDSTVDKKLARILVQDVLHRIKDLESYGIKFKKDNEGNYISVMPCFAQRKRSVSARGMETIRTALTSQVYKRKIRIIEDFFAACLITENNTCSGVIGIDSNNGLTVISSLSAVIAAGGGISLYPYNYSIGDLTGDGYSMALDAGAFLVNMEFIQFIPATMYPVKGLLFEQRALRHIDKVKSNKFVEQIQKSAPGKNIEKMLRERSEHAPFSASGQGVYIDAVLCDSENNNNEALKLYFKDTILKSDNWVVRNFGKRMKDKNIDIYNNGISLRLFAQGFNGGIMIDKNAFTGVKGLYACGEAAGGMHGGNRMGGCAMASTQVFGKIAGKSAAEYAKKSAANLTRIKNPYTYIKMHFNNKTIGLTENIDPDKLINKIKNIMWNTCGAARDNKKCQNAIKECDFIKKHLDFSRECENISLLKKKIELYNMLNSVKAVIYMIKNRKESVGPHFRQDYPAQNENYRCMFKIKKEKSQFSISKRDD